jgi:hypothetical protein
MEVLDEIVFKALGHHFLEPIVRTERVIAVKPKVAWKA